MAKKPIMIVLLICLLAAAPLSAATVSFLVIETGLARDMPSIQYSTIWENSLLDVFFEYGHIVSNSPLMRLYQKPDDGFPYEAERDYDEAHEGGMNYFIVAILEYPSQHGNANMKPKNVCLRLFTTKSQEMIVEQKYIDKDAKTQKEDYDNIKKAIAEMAVRVK